MNKLILTVILTCLIALLLVACAISAPTPAPAAHLVATPTTQATAPESAASATLAPAAPALATPYAAQPAAGICAEFPGDSVVSVEILPDMPSPRCLKVTADQRLKVTNHSGGQLSLKLGDQATSLQANADYTFEVTFGEMLVPGVHLLDAAPFFGPEIWLVEK